MTTVGFDPDNLNERVNGGYTPLFWFIEQGNVTMVRYVIARGADCRQADPDGCSPMYYAAIYGRLEIMKLLSRDGGAHEDIRRVFRGKYSPLYIAFAKNQFHVVQWLIQNEALSSPYDDAAGDGVDDALMRHDLRQISECGKYSRIWDYDHRQTVLTWACDAVTTHDNVVKLPLAELNGDVLKRIADYVVGTPKQVRTLRQLVDRLQVFIADEPFEKKTVVEGMITIQFDRSLWVGEDD